MSQFYSQKKKPRRVVASVKRTGGAEAGIVDDRPPAICVFTAYHCCLSGLKKRRYTPQDAVQIVPKVFKLPPIQLEKLFWSGTRYRLALQEISAA